MISCSLLETNRAMVIAKRDRLKGGSFRENHVYNKTNVLKLYVRVCTFRVHPPKYVLHLRWDVHYGVLVPTEVASIYDLHVMFWEHI